MVLPQTHHQLHQGLLGQKQGGDFQTYLYDFQTYLHKSLCFKKYSLKYIYIYFFFA